MKLVLGYMLSAVERRFLRAFPACTRSVCTSRSLSSGSSFNRASSLSVNEKNLKQGGGK